MKSHRWKHMVTADLLVSAVHKTTVLHHMIFNTRNQQALETWRHKQCRNKMVSRKFTE